jgi:ribosomal protein L37AE/L43A
MAGEHMAVSRKTGDDCVKSSVTKASTGSGEMEMSMTANARPLLCPMCEAHELHSFGRNSARCGSCQFVIGGAFLKALLQITGSPVALGNHACECGHPEMRRIPDGVYRCPACGSEVLPLSAGVYVGPENRSVAYWSGWLEGRYGEHSCFTENRNLATWESAEDRLEYYRGHRSGREGRERVDRLKYAS